MLKVYSLAGVVSLGGAIAGVAWLGACSSDVTTGTAPDASTTNEGGSTSSSSGGDSDSGDGKDSGNSSSSGDSGSKSTANIPIKYGTCDQFTPCGGDVKGTWKVTGGCLSDDTFAAAKEKCPGLQESDVDIKAGGEVVVTDTNVKRTTIVTITAKIAIPEVCAAQAGGNCAFVGVGLTTEVIPGAKFDKASCKANASKGCDCDVERTIEEETDDAYTVAGNTLTTTDPTRTFDYCVDGNKNTYQETTAESLPVIVELTKN